MGENVLFIIEKFRDKSTWQDQHLHSPALHLSKADHISAWFGRGSLASGRLLARAWNIYSLATAERGRWDESERGDDGGKSRTTHETPQGQEASSQSTQ